MRTGGWRPRERRTRTRTRPAARRARARRRLLAAGVRRVLADYRMAPGTRPRPGRAARDAGGRPRPIAAAVEGFIHTAAGRPDAARRAYQVALAAPDGLCTPHEEALTRLDYGRFLRHQRQGRAARRELYAARAAFARLGAVPFLAHCDAELSHEVPVMPSTPAEVPVATAVPAENALVGGPSAIATRSWPAPLTARQLAVAAGKSNRQVARDLYITVNTVEYHVSQIFAKLGIDARTDIAAAL